MNRTLMILCLSNVVSTGLHDGTMVLTTLVSLRAMDREKSLNNIHTYSRGQK